jgi:hypothetical protein
MHRLYIFIILLLFIPFGATGQEVPKGKWYMFSRNRMVELDFLREKVVSKQMTWDLSEGGRKLRDTQYIKHSRRQNGNLYLYMINPARSGNKILVNTIRVVRPGKEIFIALNGTEMMFEDTVSVDRYIASDTSEKFGMPLFSKNEILKYKKQRNIKTMTVDDFRSYANTILTSKSKIDSLSNLSDPPDGLLYYGYALIRTTIADMGYNPLFNSKEFDEFILYFKNNPETAAIVSKMFKEEE